MSLSRINESEAAGLLTAAEAEELRRTHVALAAEARQSTAGRLSRSNWQLTEVQRPTAAYAGQRRRPTEVARRTSVDPRLVAVAAALILAAVLSAVL